jgi:lysophospholipase L1-like esterase
VTLPTGAPEGAQISVEKTDAGTNTVTLTGSIRGATASVSLAFQSESLLLRADSTGSWRPIAGHRTKSSLDGIYYQKPASGIPTTDIAPAIVTVGTPGLIPVASSASTFGSGTANWGSDTLRSWKNKHTMIVTAPSVSLEFVNWYPNGTGADVDAPSAMTLRVGIEKAGSILPVKFAGADTVTIPPGGSIIADPVYIDGTAGDVFYTRVTATLATGNTYVYTGAADAGYAFNPAQDNSRSGTNYAGGANQSVVPTRILGRPATAPARVFALVGDSIVQGALATTQYEGGYASGLLSAGVPFVKIAKGGESAFNVTSLGGFSRRLSVITGCTDAIVEYGTNDAVAGRTAAQLQADLVTIYGRLTRMGIKRIWQTTITPRTTSTDSFATTANQTPVSGFAVGGARDQVNAWIRANTAGITGYIEVADAVESSRNSGAWKPSFTTDGVHPSQTGHTAIASLVTTIATS